MKTATEPDVLAAFPTELGWFAMVGAGDVLKHVTIGHRSQSSAIRAVQKLAVGGVRLSRWNQSLADRLQAYASGERDDFRDVQVDLATLTPFRRRVLEVCRRIPYGRTARYGEIAARCGSLRAARAVGAAMAANPLPIVIPCHRVVSSDGRLGGYSARGGVAMKRRLLELESGRPVP